MRTQGVGSACKALRVGSSPTCVSMSKGEIYNEWKRKQRIKIRELVESGKDRPCCDCGVKYPSHVMQYDHVRGDKKFNLGEATAKGRSLKAVQEEIDKCEVVCANCHAERTWQRLQ